MWLMRDWNKACGAQRLEPSKCSVNVSHSDYFQNHGLNCQRKGRLIRNSCSGSLAGTTVKWGLQASNTVTGCHLEPDHGLSLMWVESVDSIQKHLKDWTAIAFGAVGQNAIPGGPFASDCGKVSAYKSELSCLQLRKAGCWGPTRRVHIQRQVGLLTSASVTEKGDRCRAISTEMELSPVFLVVVTGLLVWKMPKCILFGHILVYLYVWEQEKLSKKKKKEGFYTFR